jgi:prepilin-type processing-associated H-X9-DG protein
LKPADKTTDITDPANTPIIREGRDGKPDPDGSVGYADGHVESKPR